MIAPSVEEALPEIRALDRPVDLVTERSIRNPIFRDIVENSKVSIYDNPFEI